jgi:hypothetical protein
VSSQLDQPAGGWGLLAAGSSGRWDITVNEALDREEWCLEIDGPQTYLAIRLQDLKHVGAALHFLESGPHAQRASGCDTGKGRAVSLGRFGSATVSLRWDDEDFPRVFLAIGPEGGCTPLWGLEEEDIRMFVEALRQVVVDLSDRAA